MRERFLKKVRICTGHKCWIWCRGWDTKKLYGRIGFVSSDSKRKKKCSSYGLHSTQLRSGVYSQHWIAHLYHNLLCVTVQRLLLELRSVNNNRISCKNGPLLTLKATRKTVSENVFCLCRLLNILANFSNLFLHTGKQCGPRSDCS